MKKRTTFFLLCMLSFITTTKPSSWTLPLPSSLKKFCNSTNVVKISLISLGAYILYSHVRKQPKKKRSSKASDFNWDVDFKKPTLQYIGVGTSAHQIEGSLPNSGWARYKTDGTTLDASVASFSKEWNTLQQNTEIIDDPDYCKGWEKKFEDITLLKELSVNCYRSSISWSRICPQRDTIDQQALAEYRLYYQTLIDAGITPIITLHHYEDPAWFLQKGGFTKKENIQDFLHFTQAVKETILDRLTLNKQVTTMYIVTFNQPVGYASKCYRSGEMPPYQKTSNMSIVNQNIVDMHVQVYHQLKPHNEKEASPLQISISHQYAPCKARHVWDRLIAWIADKKTNGSFTNFFKKHADTLDFVALSYYSPLRFTGIHPQGYYQHERKHPCKPDDFRIFYPQGMIEALQWASQFSKPIFVVENGIATQKDNVRNYYLKAHLDAIAQFQAQSPTHEVLGYCYWSFMDNFENQSGIGKYNFGVYRVDFTKQEKTRTLKPSGEFFKKYIQNCFDSQSKK